MNNVQNFPTPAPHGDNSPPSVWNIVVRPQDANCSSNEIETANFTINNEKQVRSGDNDSIVPNRKDINQPDTSSQFVGGRNFRLDGHAASNHSSSADMYSIAQQAVGGKYVAPNICDSEHNVNVSFLIPVYFGQPELIIQTSSSFHLPIHGPVVENIINGNIIDENIINGQGKSISFLEYIADENLMPCDVAWNTYEIENQSTTKEYVMVQGNVNDALCPKEHNISTVQDTKHFNKSPGTDCDTSKSTYYNQPEQVDAIFLPNTPKGSETGVHTTTKDGIISTDSQTSPEQHGCQHCKRVFTRKDNLKRHLRNAHGDKSVEFKCGKCGIGIKRNDNLLHHESYCEGYKQSPGPKNATPESRVYNSHHCVKCKLTFRRKQELTRHEAKIHSDSKESFACQTCEYQTPYKNLLKRHEALHHTARNTLYMCPKCHVDCKTGYAFTKHRKANCKVDVPVCKYCFIKFQSLEKLKVHFRQTHSDVLEEVLEIDYIDYIDSNCFSSSEIPKANFNRSKTPVEFSPSYILNKLDQSKTDPVN